MTPPDSAGPPTPWRFEVDADEIDLPFTFADGEAVLEFEVDEDDIERVAPGQRAELRIRGTAADSGPYAAGHVVGPVRWVEEDGERYPVVEVGLDLVAGAHAEPVSATADDAIVLPALEVRLPADTLLVVEAGDGGWTVVRGTADMTDVEELPDRHRTFIDAVEYVASVAQQAARDLPVVDLDDELEAVAIFDADRWRVRRGQGRTELVRAVLARRRRHARRGRPLRQPQGGDPASCSRRGALRHGLTPGRRSAGDRGGHRLGPAQVVVEFGVVGAPAVLGGAPDPVVGDLAALQVPASRR